MIEYVNPNRWSKKKKALDTLCNVEAINELVWQIVIYNNVDADQWIIVERFGNYNNNNNDRSKDDDNNNNNRNNNKKKK